MNPTTKEIIKLALENDKAVPQELAEAIFRLFDGRLQANRGATDEPLLMMMTAAAKALGVSRVTLWRMVKEGILRPVEITPRVFRIRREDIHELASKRSKYRPVRRGSPARQTSDTQINF